MRITGLGYYASESGSNGIERERALIFAALAKAPEVPEHPGTPGRSSTAYGNRIFAFEATNDPGEGKN